ncbi:MAG: hypothetical protein AUG79_04720 [Gemmatimonadetes bacterium 13_1_20CM_4_69_16]|nr:MAG: hypothetical protein AUG79_04720 [Gemmatimonadetes bacterium 13_1_20CM_4_69_16]
MGLAALIVGGAAAADAQGWVTDARRIGMGGLGLDQSSLRRYNAAYRAVPARSGQHGQPKLTIPIPLGLIQFFHDHPLSNISNDPAFNHDSAGFNPVELLNTFLNPPLFLEVKKAPTPTNDVVFGIGKDSLRVNLGQTAKLVPEDQFGIGGSSRPLDPNFSIKGVRVGVMGWLHDDIGFTLGDTLLGFLRDSQPARPRTRYNILGDGTIEAGFAPSVGYAGRIVGDSATALYLGGALHYYVGLAYGHVTGDGGFTTGDSIFTGPTPVKPDARALTSYSKFGNSVGHGFGGDVGLALVTGPIELGIGVNDIGATITWPDTRRDSAFYRDSTAAHNGPPVRYSTPVLPNHIETKTKLPVSYLVNLAYTVGKTTLGADVLNNGRGTTVHVGGEQRVGVIVLRGGVARDQRKRLELGWGGGLRFGGLGLDVGFWTHTNSLSNQRGITMATSLSIY